MTSTTEDRDDRSSPGGDRLRAKSPFEFFAQVRQEARRVTWATRQEVQVSTLMVVLMVLAAIVFFAAVDGSLHLLIQTFLLPRQG